MKITNPLLGGTIYNEKIDGWNVSWESNGIYRHWCYQEHPSNKVDALLVLFNPGTLNTPGKKLSQDPTLNILREVFIHTGINPFVINLFDYSSPDYKKLCENWEIRDPNVLVYHKLTSYDFIKIIYAYGKIDEDDKYYADIKDRINEVENVFNYLTELKIGNKRSHPRRWQFEKQKSEIHNLLSKLV